MSGLRRFDCNNAREDPPENLGSINKEVQEDDYLLHQVAGRPAENSWELPARLAEFVNRNSREYVAPAQLREQITKHYPTPANIDGPHELDQYMRALLRQNNMNSSLYRDEAWKTTQEMLHASLGPLCDTWDQVEHSTYT